MARLDLVRTSRDLGLALSTIRSVLDDGMSSSQVADVHARALDTQIDSLRLRRVVLRAVAKRTTTTAGEAALMHQLAKMSDTERARVIQDFVDSTFGDLDADPRVRRDAARGHTGPARRPDPRAGPGWVELAEFVQDTDLRASIRRMAEHQAAERAAGDQTGLHPNLTAYVRDIVTEALDADTALESFEAVPVLDGLVRRYAGTFGTADSDAYRKELARRLEVASDPRAERYWQLLGTTDGWPAQPTLAPAFDWSTRAPRAHPSRRTTAD